MLRSIMAATLLCAGCANTSAPNLDPENHVDRVLEDVSAMIEGMTSAHTSQRVVLRGPEYRSSAPPSYP